MQAGKLDQQIIIQTPSETNTSGEVIQTYATLATVWGYVYQSRGNEAIQSAQVKSREAVRVAIRHRDDVTVKSRIQWAGQTYNIVHIDRTTRRDGVMWLTCEILGAS